MIKIAVTGASGRMGQTLIEAIEQTKKRALPFLGLPSFLKLKSLPT
jgi:dihydrodipicolinate reductase